MAINSPDVFNVVGDAVVTNGGGGGGSVDDVTGTSPISVSPPQVVLLSVWTM